jgi:orotidine-5'-phosphate decarboxylase
VLGLDPDPAAVWPAAGGGEPSVAVERHCVMAMEAAGGSCVGVKLQLACFERLGWRGWRALQRVATAARERGLLAIADGKRGDVPVTAEVYGEALAGEWPGLGADAFTANPLLGRDSLEPLLRAADGAGAGCFVLVRTSNPGADELQVPIQDRLTALVDELGSERVGDSGLSSVGAVVGATRPELLAELRTRMPRVVFLLPGVGAQGGRVEDLAPAFAPHRAAGLVTASRSIVNAHAERGGDPAEAAAAAAEELREAAWAL